MHLKKQQLEPYMEQKTVQIEKGVCQGCILSPSLFNFYAEYLMRNAQVVIKIAGRNINSLRYTYDTNLMAESKEEIKSLLMKVKEESEKSRLKTQHSKNEDHGIWSRHFMANGETVRNFIFWGSRITADGDYNHEIKRCLLLGRKAMTNLDSILKSRDITLPTKVRLVKAVIFPVVTYECESQNI